MNDHPLESAPRDRFTLIELLVVVAIISVLASMLLPALGKARERVKTTACANNQKGIGLAFAMHTSDNDGFYPYANPAGAWQAWPNALNWPWRMSVREYLGGYTFADTPKQLFCPGNPWAPYGGTNNQSRPPSTYGYGPAFPNNWHDQSGINPTIPGNESHYVKGQRTSRLVDASGLLFMGEVPNGAASASSWNRSFNANTVETFVFWTWIYFDYWRTEEICAKLPSGGSLAMLIHDVKWNSLMADGHVSLDSKDFVMGKARDVYSGAWGPGDLWWNNIPR